MYISQQQGQKTDKETVYRNEIYLILHRVWKKTLLRAAKI